VGGLSRVEMNAQKPAPLTAHPPQRGKVCLIFRLTRPTTS
jgi:hypothetical protein